MVLAVLGILFTVSGASVASRYGIMNEDDAIRTGVPRYAGDTREKKLRLPAVQALSK
jgi:hypothetical protein